MALLKYIFLISEYGIRTYKLRKNGEYEIKLFRGEEYYKDTNLEKFLKEFDGSTPMLKNDIVDFCFLSEKVIDESPVFDYGMKEKSTWTKKQIKDFCAKHISSGNYEVVVGDKVEFSHQSGNVLDKESVKKLYLKCIPSYEVNETEKKIENEESQTTLLYEYYRKKLDSLPG